jgi:hypothetical protein
LGVDQLFYKGAAFETVYRTLFPEYGSKIIAHEAGHFLIAYLLGVPVRECVTNAWDARLNPDIKGQAGTIFFDSKLAEEMDKQQSLQWLHSLLSSFLLQILKLRLFLLNVILCIGH